jgi:hypothetical protein
MDSSGQPISARRQKAMDESFAQDAFTAAALTYRPDGKDKDRLPQYWRSVPPPQGMEADFKAAVCDHLVSPAGDHYIAFRGTEVTDVTDWKNNLGQGATVYQPQYEAAARIAEHFRDNRDTPGYEHNVTYTGHSLGGGKAQLAAEVASLAPSHGGAEAEPQVCVAINAAPVHRQTYEAHGCSPHTHSCTILELENEHDILTLGRDLTPTMAGTIVQSVHKDVADIASVVPDSVKGAIATGAGYAATGLGTVASGMATGAGAAYSGAKSVAGKVGAVVDGVASAAHAVGSTASSIAGAAGSFVPGAIARNKGAITLGAAAAVAGAVCYTNPAAAYGVAATLATGAYSLGSAAYAALPSVAQLSSAASSLGSAAYGAAASVASTVGSTALGAVTGTVGAAGAVVAHPVAGPYVAAKVAEAVVDRSATNAERTMGDRYNVKLSGKGAVFSRDEKTGVLDPASGHYMSSFDVRSRSPKRWICGNSIRSNHRLSGC